MMQLRHRFLTEVLRLSLAAIVLVAGLATARMQGQIGAVFLASGGTQVLCSGVALAGDPLDDPARHQHDNCILCHVSAVPPGMAPMVPSRIAQIMARPVFDVKTAPVEAHFDYHARAPPLFG